MGVVLALAGPSEPDTIPYRRFAEELGVLFQIVDDILDVTGSDEELGKPHGSDERHGKLTYVSLFGLERARELAAESHRKAQDALSAVGGDPRDLSRITDFIYTRHAMSDEQPKLLHRINGPGDLKALNDGELQAVAQEVRELIIDVIGEIGGHFGANLGACELAVALHSLLDSPRDKIIWDVGHQAYPHKVLTGRRERLDTIRQYGGLAPFCSVFESEHDIMGAGHASTSIGYAVGLKEAMRKGIGTEGHVIAVIGDGALTGGVAYEALHNAGGLETPIVIVLNDNGMSISPNVGALARYFQRFRLNPTLYHAREGVEERLTRLPLGLGGTIERLGPGDQGGDQGLRGAGAPVRGARSGLRRRDRRPRRGSAAPGDRRRPGRPAAGRRPHPHGQGQGLRRGRGGRPRGDGEVARGEAEIDHQQSAGRVLVSTPGAAGSAKGRPAPSRRPLRRRRSRSSRSRRLRRRPSTRPCSPARWWTRRSGIAG